MEKYYLASLTNPSGPRVDLERRIKLVEIQFTRRPPTFGLVHFHQASSANHPWPATIQLTSLEFSNNNTAEFRTARQVELDAKLVASCLVDFDTSESIMLEEGSGGGCIVLARDGSLLFVQLIDGGVKCLTSGYDLLQQQINDGQFLQCRLQHSAEQLIHPAQHPSDEDECYVHLLAERAYSLHKLSKFKLQPVHRYSLTAASASRPDRHFKGLHVIGANPDVVVVELNDSSLRVIQQAHCMAELNLTDNLGLHQRHLVSAGGSSPTEAILMSYGRRHIVAHSLTAATDQGRPDRAKSSQASIGQDPDGLILKEPSFELDLCWSLDLNDIESVRSLTEEKDEERIESEPFQGCLSLMWSGTQLNTDDSPAKFLIVAYKHHLLVYSFEQRPSLPFSVVYDKSFLQVEQLDTASKPHPRTSTNPSEFVDQRLRPCLIHNFKLIGAHTSDILFNGIFLSSPTHLIECRYFALLALLVAVTSSGDLLAFRCTSSLVSAQRNSLYQQMVADSLRCSSLLESQAGLIEKGIQTTRANITSLETKSIHGKQFLQNLDDFITTELRGRNEIGCLYNISMSITNPIQVSRILLISTLNSSHMLEPTNQQAIESILIENGISMEDSDLKPLLLAGIDSNDLTANIDKFLHDQTSNEEIISSFAKIEFHCARTQMKTQLELPIFITDGQSGYLKVFYVLVAPEEADLMKSQVELLDSSWSNSQGWQRRERIGALHRKRVVSNVHAATLPIKLLMSYRSSPDGSGSNSGDNSMSCQFVGAFPCDAMTRWLGDCFDSNSDRLKRAHFKSTFTQCFIECLVGDNRATITSDDLTALDLVKQQVLKRATDERIKLEIACSSPVLRHLRHLIDLQLTNISTANRLSALSNLNVSVEDGEGLDLLLENLTSELNLSDFPSDCSNSVEALGVSLQQDVRSLKMAHKQNELEKESLSSVLTDLVCGFIIDALTDFDKLKGGKLSSAIMVLMRTKLDGIRSFDKSSFCETILSKWNEVQQNYTC